MPTQPWLWHPIFVHFTVGLLRGRELVYGRGLGVQIPSESEEPGHHHH